MPAVWPVWPNCGTMACPRAKYCSHHCVDDSCGCGRLAHAATGHRNRCAPGHWPAPAAKVVNLEIMFHITPHFFTEYNSLFVDVHNLSWAPAEYKHRPHTAVLHPGSLSVHKHLFAHLTLASVLNLESQHWGTDSSSYWNTSLKAWLPPIQQSNMKYHCGPTGMVAVTSGCQLSGSSDKYFAQMLELGEWQLGQN